MHLENFLWVLPEESSGLSLHIPVMLAVQKCPAALLLMGLLQSTTLMWNKTVLSHSKGCPLMGTNKITEGKLLLVPIANICHRDARPDVICYYFCCRERCKMAGLQHFPPWRAV